MSSNSTYSSDTTGPRWPLWAMSLFALIISLIFWRSCEFSDKSMSDTPPPAPAMAPPAAAAPAAASAPADPAYAHKLSSGFELKGNTGGIEDGLIGFIESDKPVDKETWFNFDRLTFKTGSAELDMDKSKDQLTNMSEILKAFPKVSLKVGGYTDNTGSEEANRKLSQQRAETVTNALVAMGTDKARLAPEGYGSQHPVCPANDTEECKAKNRRIAVRVTAK